MQPTQPIGPGSVAVLGTNRDKIVVTNVNDQVKELLRCRVAKLTVNPPMSQIFVTEKGPSSDLQMAETHFHLMKRGLAMVMRGICDVIWSRSFKTLIANWSKLSITLPQITLVAQCNLCPITM